MKASWFVFLFIFFAACRLEAAVSNADNDGALFASDGTSDPGAVAVPVVKESPGDPSKIKRLNQFDTRMDASAKTRAAVDTPDAAQPAADSEEEWELEGSEEDETVSGDAASGTEDPKKHKDKDKNKDKSQDEDEEPLVIE